MKYLLVLACVFLLEGCVTLQQAKINAAVEQYDKDIVVCRDLHKPIISTEIDKSTGEPVEIPSRKYTLCQNGALLKVGETSPIKADLYYFSIRRLEITDALRAGDIAFNKADIELQKEWAKYLKIEAMANAQYQRNQSMAINSMINQMNRNQPVTTNCYKLGNSASCTTY